MPDGNDGVVLASISTIIIILIVVIGYFYTNRKINQMETDVTTNMQKLVSQVNQTGFNKYELDVQQNSLLKANTKTINDLQQKEAADFTRLSSKLEQLKKTEAEDMQMLTSNLAGMKGLGDGTIESLNEEITGMQSILTSLGANVNILTNTINSMPLDQQIQQLGDIKSSIANITSYNNNNDGTLSQMQDSITANNTATTNLQKQFMTNLGGYVKQSDLDAYKINVNTTYAKAADLNNYVQLTDLQSDYATIAAFNDLQRQVTDNNNNVANFYALKSDLSPYVTTSDLANYATQDMLAGYAKSSDLNNYLPYTDYNNNLTDLNNKIDGLQQTLIALPSSYGTKNDVDNLMTLVLRASTDLATIKAQYENVISNYVTQTTFAAAQSSTQQAEAAEASTVQNLQDSVTGLVTTVNQIPGTYLKINDAAATYTPLTTTQTLTNTVNALPDQNMKDAMQIYLKTYFAAPSDVQAVQQQLTNLGNVAAVYATKADLSTLASSINMSTLVP